MYPSKNDKFLLYRSLNSVKRFHPSFNFDRLLVLFIKLSRQTEFPIIKVFIFMIGWFSGKNTFDAGTSLGKLEQLMIWGYLIQWKNTSMKLFNNKNLRLHNYHFIEFGYLAINAKWKFDKFLYKNLKIEFSIHNINTFK